MFWDTPRRPVITHTSDSHQIPSQNKTSKLHILNSVRARIITGSQKVSPPDPGGPIIEKVSPDWTMLLFQITGNSKLGRNDGNRKTSVSP